MAKILLLILIALAVRAHADLTAGELVLCPRTTFDNVAILAFCRVGALSGDRSTATVVATDPFATQKSWVEKSQDLYVNRSDAQLPFLSEAVFVPSRNLDGDDTLVRYIVRGISQDGKMLAIQSSDPFAQSRIYPYPRAKVYFTSGVVGAPAAIGQVVTIAGRNFLGDRVVGHYVVEAISQDGQSAGVRRTGAFAIHSVYPVKCGVFLSQ